MAKLLSVNVGMPKDVAWRGRTVHTGIWKSPVDGPVMVRRLNVEGDGQGDLAGHGGEQRAVLVYQVDSYRHWEQYLGREPMEYGTFGENFTVTGMPDTEVCIGDRYRIGEAELEVTQPRVTCFRVGMRLGEPRLPSLLVAHGRPGFYLRVIREGRVRAGDEVVRTSQGRHRLSVADIDALLYLPGRDPDLLRAAVDIPALSPGWQGSFQNLLDADEQAGPRPGTEPGVAPPRDVSGWHGFRTLTVASVVAESDTVTSIYLTGPGPDPLPAPIPGQYLTLRLPDAGSPAPVRSYSLSGEPSGAGYRISVKREPGGRASSYLHSRVRRGSHVQAAAPRGTFTLDTDPNPVLLISAGIGVTPVLAMLHRLAAERTCREVWWLHTTRDAGTHAFAAEVDALLAELPRARSRVYYTGSAHASSANPAIVRGRLDAATIAQLDLPPDASAYLCGPQAFMDEVGTALTGAGLRGDRVHTEQFGSRSAINPGILAAEPTPPHRPPGPDGPGPAVTFARSGLTAHWSGAYGSVLELAEACDVPTQWSCRTGVCHTCLTDVLAGEADYVAPPLEPPPPDELLICSARPRTDLVLDL